MHKSSLFAAAAFTVVLGAATMGSAQTTSTHKKTVGYQDENGVFHTFAHPEPDVAANTVHTGKYVFNYTVKIDSSIPSGSTIYCSADILFSSVQTVTTPPYDLAVNYDETGTGSVAATAPGTSVVCQVIINYSWSFPASSATVMNSVNGSYTVGAYKPSTTITINTVDGSRSSTGDLAIPAAPLATGGSLTVAVPVTL